MGMVSLHALLHCSLPTLFRSLFPGTVLPLAVSLSVCLVSWPLLPPLPLLLLVRFLYAPPRPSMHKPAPSPLAQPNGCMYKTNGVLRACARPVGFTSPAARCSPLAVPGHQRPPPCPAMPPTAAAATAAAA